jgi:hypothetical protein
MYSTLFDLLFKYAFIHIKYIHVYFNEIPFLKQQYHDLCVKLLIMRGGGVNHNICATCIYYKYHV